MDSSLAAMPRVYVYVCVCVFLKEGVVTAENVTCQPSDKATTLKDMGLRAVWRLAGQLWYLTGLN